MRIGICAYWFNRGQGVVARQLRSALDALGHETFVLARPTRASEHPAGVRRPQRRLGPAAGDRGLGLPDPGRRAASPGGARTSSRSRSSTRTTSSRRSRRCARSGVRTVGRFVWEQFSAEHVEPAKRAFDVDLLADRLRAGALRGDGDREPARALGHPPRAAAPTRPTSGRPAPSVASSIPAGFLSKRKPVAAVAARRSRRVGDERGAADRQGPGRARARDARARRQRATRGSR